MAINDFFVWGSGGEKLTPEQVKRQQMQAQALQQAGADFSPAGHWSVALGRGLSGFMGGFQDRRARDAENAGIASANEAFNNAGIAELLMGGGGASPQVGGVTTPQVGGGAAQTPLPQNTASGAGGSFLSAIDKTEGGGNYDTLFGHAQKGGQFGNVRVSQMPISEVIAFASPSGQYGQSVKGKVGHVATPMGRYQIVGSTLKQAAKEMGLDPSTPFSPQVQDAMATHIAQKAISGKSDSQAINALRNTWEGFKSVPDSQMVSILGELRGGKAPSAGVQVASADPNFMPDVSSREIPLTALQPSPVAEALATQPQHPQAMAAPASQPSPVSEALLAQHDKALGGSLAFDAGVGSGQQAGLPPPQQQRTAPNMSAILQLANNPYLNDTQRTILGSVLQQQMQANDPLRALKMQQAQQGLTKGELEIAAMQQPKDPEYGFQTLGDGTVVRTNKATGEVVPAYEGTPKPTTDVQNYEYATKNPGFVDYQQQLKKAGASSTNVNVGGEGMPGLGKLSSDYGYVLNPETGQPVIDPSTGLPQAAPVPGSPAARQIEEETRAKEAGKRNASDYARTVVQDVGIAKNYLSSLDGLAAADGVVGANYRKTRAGIPGTPEYNMTQFVESALSNVTLDTMNRMRETSAAGATGMGNMSDKQLKVIQGVLGQWDPGLPVKDQQLILSRLSDFYMDVQYGSKSEREDAIKQGRMTKEESEAIDSLYSASQGNNGGWQEINGVKIRVKQ